MKLTKSDNLGHVLKQARLAQGWTQAQLAKQLGIAQNYITYLENDERKPSDELLSKLAKVLRLSAERLHLLNRPELKSVFEAQQNERVGDLPQLLQDLKANRTLRQQHEITNEDIMLLASIRARGHITRVEDYVYLLMTIRQVFKG